MSIDSGNDGTLKTALNVVAPGAPAASAVHPKHFFSINTKGFRNFADKTLERCLPD
jgi:hypothetical protein